MTIYLVVFSYFSKGNSQIDLVQTGQRVISPQIEGACAVFGKALEFFKHFSSAGVDLN